MKNIPASDTKRKPLSLLQSRSNPKTLRTHESTIMGKQQFIGEPLEVSMPEVVFTEIEADQSYEIQFQIKNVTAHSRLVKLVKPKDPRFELSEGKETALAPGLSFKVSVLFYVREVTELHTSMRILSDNYQHELPISAYPPSPCLIFEPFVNFGYVRVGKPRTQTIEVHNQGSVAAEVTFECDIPEVTISPKKLSLESKGRTKLNLTMTASAAGTLGGLINILPKQRMLSEIEFSATVMEFSRFIINEQGNQIQDVQVKPMLVGEKHQFNVFIINNTPKASNYRLSQKKGSEIHVVANTTPEEVGREDTERILYFQPMQGRMEAYSQTKVVFDIEGKVKPNFQQAFLQYATGPLDERQNPDMENKWEYVVTFHFDDDEKEQLKLPVGGTCLIPRVRLSSNVLEYGVVNVGQHSLQPLSLSNKSDSSIMVNFPKSKNYDFKPSRAKVAPHSSFKVEVRFHPKKNGQLNEVYMIEVGAFRLPLKLFGVGRITGSVHGASTQAISHRNYNSTLELSSICKTVIATESSRYFDMSKMHISSICEKYTLGSKEEPLKILRKQRLDKQKEEELAALASNCKTYDDNKPMDYEFENKLNASVADKLPQLSLSKDPLYVDRRQAHLPRSISKTNAAYPFKDNSGFDPFKSAAEYSSQFKNQNEERIVSRQLQPEELRQVQVGPTTIPIDNIFINAQREATFHIVNNNKLPISIQMVYNDEQLAGSSKQLQILPGGSAGGLKLNFKALEFGQFRLPVQYILNGKHFFEFSVVGTVILPSLNLSRTELKFCLTEEDKEFSKCEKLSLKNMFDYEAKFKWVSPSGMFEVTPEEGVVAPHSDLPILVKYHPNKSTKEFQMQQRNDEEKLRLRIIDGNEIQLKCSSQITESSCFSKPLELNFKQTAICKVSEQRFMIKNNGRSGTAIQIECPPELEGVVQVSPQKKHLSIDENVEITVKLSSNKSGSIDSALTILVRCGKALQVPIRGNIILPKVSIMEEEIDFGSTPKSGTPAIKTCTLNNDSNIWVDLELNLGTPESILYRCLELNLDKVDDRLTITTTKPKDPKHTKPLVYHIRIAPKCECKITLMFIPEEVMPYSFNLPLNISGYNEYIEGLCRPVSCKGILNKLVVEPKQIDFKRVIIQSQKGLCKYQEIRLSNPTSQGIQWWTGNQEISPFSMEHTRGTIRPFSTETVRVSFYPNTRGEYSKQICFYIDEPQMELTHCYIKIAVRACSDFPCILFDRPYVLMPVVPLNTQSRCSFQIFNDGYENLNLKHIVVQELSNIDITLQYPNGSNLGITRKRIKVEAVFKHDRPLSFTLNVEFYDENNRVYTLPISGTTDNCIYTTQDYYAPTVLPGDQTALTPIQELDNECSYLKRYLNSHVCFERQIGKFPESMLQNELELLFEVLCFYSTSFDKLRLSRKCQTVQMTFTLLDEIIRVLKSEGALLNHIRPELLMGYTECTAYFRSIESAEKYYQIPWTDNEEEYNILQKRSWVVLIYQILRIYNSYRSNGGRKTSAGKVEQSTQKLSTQQKLLIGWVEGIVNTHESRFDAKPLENFSGLQDCEILGALLQKFTGVKVIEAYGKTGLNRKDIQRRCAKFVQVLATIGVSTHIQADDIERSRHREMMLLVEQLYQILPNYLPKSPPIQFTCSLGQSVSKIIEISNPSKHIVSYWAKIEGSKDFQLESQPAFVIQPKKSVEFRIKYMSHFSNSSSATATFIGKKDNKSLPATMVFTLKGQTVGKISQKCIQATCSLYEQIEFSVSVTNNLGTEGDFRVQLIPEKGNRPPSFFCLTDKLRVKKGSNAMLSVIFAPLILEQQKCYLYFSDPNVGEFQYEMAGIVEMPLLSNDILKVTTPLYVETPATVELALPLKNDLLMRARKQIQAIAENKNSRITKGQQLYPKILPEQYLVELLPATDMITCAKEISLNLNEEEEGVTKRDQNRKLQLNINMRMAVRDGIVLLVLRNASRTDIRRYKIVLNVINKPFRYVMEIRTHLFKQVIQPVPMVNPTQQPNTYSVHMLQDPKLCFAVDCEKEVIVEAGRTEHVNLVFRPKAVGVFNSLLKMENITISQVIEYQLVGISEEPESIQLSYKQNAKETKVYDIKLQNQSNLPQRYAVKLDLDYASGAPTIMVPPFSTVNYQLTLAPRYIGQYKGTVVFDDEGRYLSYKVSVDTRETQPTREYNLVCKERVPTYLQVQIEEGLWTVVISSPNMTGTSTFESANGHQKYKLTYLSGRVSEAKVYVYFHNEQKGDFSYLVNVTIVQASEVKLNPFKAELGKAQTEIIEIENIEDTKLKVQGSSTNPNTFSLEPSSFSIPPKSKFPVKIIYTPSNLELESSDIILEAETGERWRYNASGVGILPTYDEQKMIHGVVNTDTSTFISFRNPFKEKIQVIISIDKQPGEQVFQLIMKNKRIEIQPLGLLSIPIVFIPRLNDRYETTLNVYMNERMSWKFIVVGLVVTTAESLSKLFRFKCRQRKSEFVEFQLPELPNAVQAQSNEWSIKLRDVHPPCFTELIEKVAVMSPQTVSLIPGTKTLKFNAELMAYRPFQATCIYELNQKNGCQWLSKIDMICQQPQPDDEITIVSDINTSSSVSFKLTNRLKAFARFNAYFTPESDIELAVSPKTGDLLPYGREGTVFTLTFSPVEYRKVRSGRLVIETDESYWSYSVRGALPHYSPPKGVSQVASRLH